MIPNWQRNGFKNKEEAIKKITADISKMYPMDPWALMDGNLRTRIKKFQKKI
ncbi:MAG: hypothetical protein UT24_C0016G0018 [Candidatus Woesebacteria bacterium GW2011_GWB1_39_12]|uniref:Uncharacterized protein n=1 Tax=Candidatus Woesebacteria bacterium GW2011_GWB1_39_12 TaxID=1618574 RepID=A0A0G0M7N6_9BACT|nr:MAG: hypothetical protein UT24_C0016G0018 [Candidatus Woesebacteria bacterium GW2011_GWB1_39_12]